MGEGAGSLTSVKVHQAPGGNSNISLTSDSTWHGEAKTRAPYMPPPEEAPIPVKNQHHSTNFNFMGQDGTDQSHTAHHAPAPAEPMA